MFAVPWVLTVCINLVLTFCIFEYPNVTFFFWLLYRLIYIMPEEHFSFFSLRSRNATCRSGGPAIAWAGKMSLFGRPNAEQLLERHAGRSPLQCSPSADPTPVQAAPARQQSSSTEGASGVPPLTRKEQESIAEIRDSPKLLMRHLMALRNILQDRDLTPDGREAGDNRTTVADLRHEMENPQRSSANQSASGGGVSPTEMDGLYAALEVSRKKQEEAERKVSVLEAEKREIARSKEQLLMEKDAEAKELRQKRMLQVVNRLMGKSAKWAFDQWYDAVGVDGDEGLLETAKGRIAELEGVIVELKRSPQRQSALSPAGSSASAEMFKMYEEQLKVANKKIQDLEDASMKAKLSSGDRSADAGQMDGLYAALEASRKKQEEAERKVSVLEAEKREIARSKEQLLMEKEAEAKELRQKRMLQVVNRLMGKSAKWAFDQWYDAVNEVESVAAAEHGKEKTLESESLEDLYKALEMARKQQEDEFLRMADLEVRLKRVETGKSITRDECQI